jgi:pheromone shutdown protein TraB
VEGLEAVERLAQVGGPDIIVVEIDVKRMAAIVVRHQLHTITGI